MAPKYHSSISVFQMLVVEEELRTSEHQRQILEQKLADTQAQYNLRENQIQVRDIKLGIYISKG
jgi:hypothetical protein